MELIYMKNVDKSMFYDGFTISYAFLEQLLSKVGALKVGESRQLTILYEGK